LPNCSLTKNEAGKSLGCIFSNGKQVVGAGSIVENFTYKLIKKKQNFSIWESLKDLEEYLNSKNIYLNKKTTDISKNVKSFPSTVIEEDESDLNEEQKLAKELVIQGKSIFITGSAGTGKSYLMKKIVAALWKKYGGEQVGITSTTGTGAVIINGSTIHSYLGIGVIGHLEKEVILTKICTNRKFLEK